MPGGAGRTRRKVRLYSLRPHSIAAIIFFISISVEPFLDPYNIILHPILTNGNTTKGVCSGGINIYSARIGSGRWRVWGRTADLDWRSSGSLSSGD